MMATRDETMRDLIAMLIRHGEAAHGGWPRMVATEWALAGFDASRAEEWLDAGAFSPAAAAALRDAGVSAREARERSPDYERGTIGYAVANGDRGVDWATAEVAHAAFMRAAGPDHAAAESELLSIGTEFLPSHIRAVRAGDEKPTAVYWRWLTRMLRD